MIDPVEKKTLNVRKYKDKSVVNYHFEVNSNNKIKEEAPKKVKIEVKQKDVGNTEVKEDWRNKVIKGFAYLSGAIIIVIVIYKRIRV